VSTGKFGRWNMGQAREAAAMLADGSTLLERASAPPEVSMSDEQLVLLDISGAHYYTLEGPVAIRIWQLLATRQSLAALVETLVQEFDIDRDRCKMETVEYLLTLLTKGLVRSAAHIYVPAGPQ
jgi:hypothetical protein